MAPFYSDLLTPPPPQWLQISSSSGLVLGLMDLLQDLKRTSASGPRLHPLFLHDLQVITDLSVQLGDAHLRLDGSGAQGASDAKATATTLRNSTTSRVQQQSSPSATATL